MSTSGPRPTSDTTPRARRDARRPLPLAFALAVAAVCAACSDADSPVVPATQAELLAAGPHDVATRELELVDRSRPTPANGSFAGLPERHLSVRVWYPVARGASAPGAPPATDGPFPLIGYAHGFLSSNAEASEVKSHLASHGYVVVAPNFPLSTAGAPGGPTLGDLPEQPADLGFAMDAVQSASGPAPDLAGVIDVTRRGIAGLSLGGGTVLLAAYHPVLHLEHIGAAIAYAPASCFFGRGLYARSVPMMIVAGDADELVPFDNGPQIGFEAAPGPTALVRLAGGNHVGFLGIDLPGVENSDATVGCAAVRAVDPSRGIPSLREGLTRGTTADVASEEGCDAEICARPFPQGMRGARQLELTRLVTLAHFEARLRGRRDAAAFLRDVLAVENADVTLSLKD